MVPFLIPSSQRWPQTQPWQEVKSLKKLNARGSSHNGISHNGRRERCTQLKMGKLGKNLYIEWWISQPLFSTCSLNTYSQLNNLQAENWRICICRNWIVQEKIYCQLGVFIPNGKPTYSSPYSEGCWVSKSHPIFFFMTLFINTSSRDSLDIK